MQIAVPGRRSVASDTPDGLVVVVPAKRNPFILLFLGAWLVGWCFGEALAARQVLTGKIDEITLFLSAWLTMWTMGGALAIYTWLWTAFGREVITLRPGALVIKRDVLGLGRLREYDLVQVKRVRVTPHASDGSWFSPSMRSRGLSLGSISFDYGAKTFHFAVDVDEAEVAMIISDLRSKHPFGDG